MTVKRILISLIPLMLMTIVLLWMKGIQHWLLALADTSRAHFFLDQVAVALPYSSSATIGITLLFACAGSVDIRLLGWSVLAGSVVTILTAGICEAGLSFDFFEHFGDFSALQFVAPAIMVGCCAALVSGCFALRVALKGNMAFRQNVPRRLRGKRAIHGEAKWMTMRDAAKLFPSDGGIVIGECYRVDKDDVSDRAFRSSDPPGWGVGGKSPLLCFDTSWGSTHGMVFAGSGGYKTTSVTIPTSLTWAGALIVLDPSKEVTPMVARHRVKAGRCVHVLDPRMSQNGFNALDWIGRYGASREEDIASVASWIMSDNGRTGGARDDFFRASALQLLTALIADVCLSGHTQAHEQTLRQVRKNLSEPEPKLRERLQAIYNDSGSTFVKENVAAFVNMTPETFSGVYSNAVKETHWLSYMNYADLVSGSSFSTHDLTAGGIDVFINIDLKTLETHSGLARVIVGSLLNAIYNRDGAGPDRALFLLDEAARLGFMRILETARDAGRKYGITLVMMFQSIGQMREAYGGRDALSKWFESASWISFAAVNDQETADYISRRCGTTTVEVDQISRSTQLRGSSRTQSKQLAARLLIQADEVLKMRADEQIVFTPGNPPLRCGRAVWFRRADMKGCVVDTRFHRQHKVTANLRR
jgi:type IV secretion system protein VirD4